MKIVCTFLLLSFSIITANSSYAFDKHPNSKLPHEAFPGMKSHQEHFPREFNDVKGIEKRMPNNLKKKRDEVQGDVYLVENAKVLTETGENRYTCTYDSYGNRLIEIGKTGHVHLLTDTPIPTQTGIC